MTASAVDASRGRLPDAYAQFTPVFERLSEPLIRVLRGLLDQFESLVGDFNRPRMAPRGEFEGLGGLTQRGDLSHILQSELLLRTEAPMEFLRRLAESETLYHDKLYTDPGCRPIYRAMVSVGPGSLGHGRLVALAALFFMARIAAARGADFHWCFLPRTDGAVWFDEVSVNGVKRLLRAASHRELSPEDVAEADALWARLALGTPAVSNTEYVDWVVGARRRLPGPPAASGAEAAVDTVSNSVAFSLDAPARGQSRMVELRVRHLDRERQRATLTLPGDFACVGALKTPFRPPPAQAVATGSSEAPSRTSSGWAPRYLMNASGDQKLVRLSDGVLLLRFDTEHRVSQSLFAPLAPHIQLAGIRLYREGFTIVVHAGRGGDEQLVLGAYHFPLAGPPRLTFRGVAQASTAHLFRQQPAFSLPSLCQVGGARIHSTSGGPFQLAFGNGEEMTFQPLYKGPRIIASNGVHDVVRVQGRGAGCIDVLRPSGYAMHRFAEGPEPLAPPKLLGVVYSHGFSSLAYSVSPNRWTFARLAAVDNTGLEPDCLTLKSCETLLAGHALPRAVAARLWSDARYGGEGEIRNIRVAEGQVTTKQPVLRLGEEASRIVAVDIGDDGVVWGVSVGQRGEPDSLFSYRKQKGGGFGRTRFDLEELWENALVLDMARLHE